MGCDPDGSKGLALSELPSCGCLEWSGPRPGVRYADPAAALINILRVWLCSGLLLGATGFTKVERFLERHVQGSLGPKLT
jgi:hypothetical protein